MSEYDIFNTDSATLAKVTEEFDGTPTVGTAFTVECDVDWHFKRVVNREGEEVTSPGITFINPHNNIDVNHRNWRFTFEGETYKLEQLSRVKNIGTGTVSHYESQLLPI